MIGMARISGCGPLKNTKDKDWQSFKALHFWLSDPRSLESIGKANTIKRG